MTAEGRLEILAALRRIQRKVPAYAVPQTETTQARAAADALDSRVDERPAAIAAPDATADAAGEALVAGFTAAARACGSTVTLAVGPGAGRLAILAALQNAGVRQVMAWDDADLPLPGLLDAIGMVGIEVIHVEPDTSAGRELLQQAKPVPVALTGALAGLADRGTVVLRYGERRTAVVPVWAPQHFVVLPVAGLLRSATDWIGELRRSGDLDTLMQGDLSLLTGPTRGNDIELTPVSGLYGPAVLHVFLIAEDRFL